MDTEVQCNLIETHFVEIPVDFQPYVPQLTLDSNIITVEFNGSKLSVPSKQQDGIHLSSSIESVYYDF